MYINFIVHLIENGLFAVVVLIKSYEYMFMGVDKHGFYSIKKQMVKNIELLRKIYIFSSHNSYISRSTNT